MSLPARRSVSRCRVKGGEPSTRVVSVAKAAPSGLAIWNRVCAIRVAVVVPKKPRTVI